LVGLIPWVDRPASVTAPPWTGAGAFGGQEADHAFTASTPEVSNGLGSEARKVGLQDGALVAENSTAFAATDGFFIKVAEESVMEA
jgi:hypothetical protein